MSREEVMSTIGVRYDTIRETSVDLELEAVVIPVADLDRSKEFYARRGRRLDADFVFDDGFGVVPFKPPGSGCSVQFGTNETSAAPSSADGLYLIVPDVSAARNQLVAWGADVSGVFHPGPGTQFQPDGASGLASGPVLYHARYGSFAMCSDPDGHGWLRQEMATRLLGRMDTEGALRGAAAAQGKHEAHTGVTDPDWPERYAAYRGAEQAGTGLPS
jgi:catechol 2,3-dioxygenase-like lactoylglutathione lyase family enzyme